MKFLSTLGIVILFITGINAQCETWNDSPKKEEAENAHVVYRQHVKSKDYTGAFEHWKIAYDIAPAADGRRDSHFKDGIAIYKSFFENETDDAKKEEYKKKIIELYDNCATCIEQKAVIYKNCSDNACVQMKKGVLLGRKAFDTYYTLRTPREQTYNIIKESVELAGNGSEYIVMKPYADLVVYMFTTEKMNKEEARNAHQTLNAIADYNIENNERLSAYYDQAKASMNGSFAKIESYIFDCEYFKNKLRPDYEADPENIEVLESIIRTLKRQGCTPEDEFLGDLETKYAKYAAEFNAAQQAEFEAKNPQVVAKRLYDEGNYGESIKKYQEAIEGETDNEKLANYYFSIASIQFRKLDSYSRARDNARKAASYKENWGRPFMLIGDMYAKSSRSCGSDAYERGKAVIAAMDKWAYAKSIDPEVAAEANRNLAKFSQYLPPKDEGFMRGEKTGQVVKVGCWIGESVKLRFN
jgi:hypothetical protein